MIRKSGPVTAPALLRAIVDRVSRLEQRRTAVIGGVWVLDVDTATGNLIATNTTTGTVQVLATP
ncbi:hypothetical protein ACEZCY_14225 [Streptacidiphilus sp. N1-12]|uniref:Uncharacterized protein n=2 Tax=Streptacidiphilus alkalitolerans TaxID=3342712 RepID=A0ABV6V9L4_9ACTN